MEKVKLGVVGCGVMGKKHIEAGVNCPSSTVVAIADLYEETAKSVAKQFNVPKYYTKVEDLLNDKNVDAVIFAFPTVGRAPLAVQALKNEKHILLEKPAAMNMGEYMQLMNAKGKLVAGCCSSRPRFLPSSAVVTDIIKSGALGNIRTVYCRCHGACGKKPDKPRPEWRLKKSLNGGGILVNWGVYDLDYLLGLTGWKLTPKTVLARTWTVPQVYASHIAPGSDADTHYMVMIMCENNIVLSIERSEYATAHKQDAWQIVGDKGALNAIMDSGAEKVFTVDLSDEQNGTQQKEIWRGKESAGAVMPDLIKDFADAILEGKQPRTSLDNYITIQKLFDAIYESAEKKCAVELK
ncbi:MAG: Gfo/Idh/MocA family oxidoreductase [Elusimicrobiota bacterium]